MKVVIAGNDAVQLMPLVEKAGLTVDEADPEVVISYGGDGTLLGAERDWPGVPKLAVRHSEKCVKCSDHKDDVLLGRLARGDLSRNVLMKVEGKANGRRLLGLNEIALEKAIPTSAVRYRIWIDDVPYSDEIVGDGLIVATPFGSSAYYRSITRSIFRAGIGVAFNNSTEQVDHLVLRDDKRLRIVITRGPAILCADNAPDPIRLEEGDEVRVAKAEESTVLLAIDTLLCNDCRRIDGPPFNRLGGLRFLSEQP